MVENSRFMTEARWKELERGKEKYRQKFREESTLHNIKLKTWLRTKQRACATTLSMRRPLRDIS